MKEQEEALAILSEISRNAKVANDARACRVSSSSAQPGNGTTNNSGQCDENKLNEDSISALCNILEIHANTTPSVVEEAMAAARILIQRNPQASVALRLQGGMKHCISAIQAHVTSPTVVFQVSSLLARLCSSSAAATYTFVKEKESLDALARALDFHIFEQDIVCSLMDVCLILAKHERGAVALLAGNGAILRVIQRIILETHATKPGVTCSIVRVLKQCAKHEGAKTVLQENEEIISLLTGIVRVMYKKKEHYKTVKRAYRASWLLSQHLLAPMKLVPERAAIDSQRSRDHHFSSEASTKEEIDALWKARAFPELCLENDLNSEEEGRKHLDDGHIVRNETFDQREFAREEINFCRHRSYNIEGPRIKEYANVHQESCSTNHDNAGSVRVRNVPFHDCDNSLVASSLKHFIDRILRVKETPRVVFDSAALPTTINGIPDVMKTDSQPGLQFESRFEGGNLRKAARVTEFEYDLMLNTDLNDPSRRCQWFYIGVKGATPGALYRFNIMNLVKKTSLFSHGMQPLILQDGSWRRVGSDISYFPSPYCQQEIPKQSKSGKEKSTKVLKSGKVRRKSTSALKTKGNHPDESWSIQWKGGLYGLSFSIEFPSSDTHYVAMCYPYSYTDLQDELAELEGQSNAETIMRRTLLCRTLSYHRGDMLTITDLSATLEHIQQRKVIVISARVHPGETNASWMMSGVMRALTSDSSIARHLRHNYVFKVVPMLNPDGVVNGSYRCSLAGVDLNRCWLAPCARQHPSIFSIRRLIEEIASTERLSLFVDLHGHSREKDIFFYGCDPDASQHTEESREEGKRRVRLLPFLLSELNQNFSYEKCAFKVQKSKMSTARVVVNRELGCPLSYTMEASFAGESQNRTHFSEKDLVEMGVSLVKGIYRLETEDHTDSLEEISRRMEPTMPRGIAEEEVSGVYT